jgi:hypothetical protein
VTAPLEASPEVASVCALLAGGRGTWVAVEEMAVGAEGRSGIQVMAGGVMVMGRLGLRRMAARAMPLAVGADGRWDGGRWGAGRDGGGWVLVVMVDGDRGGGRGSC